MEAEKQDEAGREEARDSVPAQEHAEQILGNLIASLGLQPVFRARPVYLEKEMRSKA